MIFIFSLGLTTAINVHLSKLNPSNLSQHPDDLMVYYNQLIAPGFDAILLILLVIF
jgi:hypothetical protein